MSADAPDDRPRGAEGDSTARPEIGRSAAETVLAGRSPRGPVEIELGLEGDDESSAASIERALAARPEDEVHDEDHDEDHDEAHQARRDAEFVPGRGDGHDEAGRPRSGAVGDAGTPGGAEPATPRGPDVTTDPSATADRRFPQNPNSRPPHAPGAQPPPPPPCSARPPFATPTAPPGPALGMDPSATLRGERADGTERPSDFFAQGDERDWRGGAPSRAAAGLRAESGREGLRARRFSDEGLRYSGPSYTFGKLVVERTVPPPPPRQRTARNFSRHPGVDAPRGPDAATLVLGIAGVVGLVAAVAIVVLTHLA